MELILLISNVLKHVGIQAFNYETIISFSKINVVEIFDFEPSITFTFIYELLKNQIYKPEFIVEANIIERVAQTIDVIDKKVSLLILEIFIQKASDNLYDSIKRFKEDIIFAVDILITISTESELKNHVVYVLSKTLNIINIEVIIEHLKQHLKYLIDLYLSSHVLSLLKARLLFFPHSLFFFISIFKL